MPGGLSLSTTATFTYNFLPYPYKGTPGSSDYQEYLLYEDITGYKMDENGQVVVDGDGNKVPEVLSQVNFIVTPSNNLESISVDAKYNGYYRTQNTELSDFQHKTTSSSYIGSIAATSAFIIYCIKDEDPVTYTKANKDWPDYLDPIPIDPSTGNHIELNPSAFNNFQGLFLVSPASSYVILYHPFLRTL